MGKTPRDVNKQINKRSTKKLVHTRNLQMTLTFLIDKQQQQQQQQQQQVVEKILLDMSDDEAGENQKFTFDTFQKRQSDCFSKQKTTQAA